MARPLGKRHDPRLVAHLARSGCNRLEISVALGISLQSVSKAMTKIRKTDPTLEHLPHAGKPVHDGPRCERCHLLLPCHHEAIAAHAIERGRAA